MTSRTQIIINVSGGLVQDVACSDPHAEIVIVDWDCDDPDSGVAVLTSSGSHKFAWISELDACPLSDLVGTDVDAALHAYRSAVKSEN